jgi:SAM-dependent methyltransferase
MRIENIKQVVKRTHGHAASPVAKGGSSFRKTALTVQCRPGSISSSLRDAGPMNQVPQQVPLALLRCGTPALDELKPGDTVLDLGSKGDIDVEFLAGAIGSIPLNLNSVELILMNCVEFLKGEIGSIPIPANSVGVIISDCVINLSADKDHVLREAFRILKPGGRLAVSDMVLGEPVPAGLRRRMEQWVWCMAAAIEVNEYLESLARAGFEEVSVQPTHIYHVEDARGLLSSKGIDVEAIAPLVEGKFMSAFVRAKKPSA